MASGFTDRGPVRRTNEDCFRIDDAVGLCIVADGMGGHNAGEVAAQMAVDAVADWIRETTTGPDDAEWAFGFDPALSHTGNRLRTAVHIANIQILEAAWSVAEYSGMGTTIVAALVVGDKLCVAHVGDSRLYVLSPSGATPERATGPTGPRLRQLTPDDSWMAMVLASDPRVDPNLLIHHPMRNALTHVVGSGSCTQVHVVEETLRGGELIALTTDGVHGVVSDAWIERVLLETSDVQDVAEQLVVAALKRGSRDNCTAVAARYST